MTALQYCVARAYAQILLSQPNEDPLLAVLSADVTRYEASAPSNLKPETFKPFPPHHRGLYLVNDHE